MSVAYGLDVESESDKFYSVTEEAISALDLALPGTFLVDTFPIRTCSVTALLGESYSVPFAVKHVPEWFPGGGFKKFARSAKKTIDKSIDLPLQHVKESFQVREPHLSRGYFFC